MYNNGSLAPVIQQRSEHSCLVHVAFHIPKDCLHFFSLPPPLLFLPLLSTLLRFLVLILLPSFSFYRLTSDCLLRFVRLVPRSLVLLSPISYITTRLASLPRSLQLQCQPSCFSFCCLWSSFSLHTDDEASNWNIS